MKFVALFSGGKDSCYNILHCIKNGHQLVALANLHPKDENQQELDSFMFQTVGHDIVSYYGDCIGLPLFRQAINANSSRNVALNYSQTDGDEVEDLYVLLQRVKDEIPEVEAVSVGAILSSYQRTRVEDVCFRSGLVVLSFLWQRNELELMTEMCSMSIQGGDEAESSDGLPKMDARLIKVAAIGLDQKHLGKSLPEVFPTLLDLNSKYEVHICGEGGEFESMVLDAPFFERGKLEMISLEYMPHQNDGVYNAKLTVKFVPRNLKTPVIDQLQELPVPSLENEWVEIYKTMMNGDLEEVQEPCLDYSEHHVVSGENIVNNMLYINNLRPRVEGSLIDQASDVFNQLDEILKRRGVFRSQILSSSLLLSDMRNFSEINGIYSSFFDISKVGPLPPSRACIESSLLPSNICLQLSVILDTQTSVVQRGKVSANDDKDGLHVQSRSYWCPCNIGPYSQVTWAKNDKNKVVYTSGQIALLPSSMDLCVTLLNEPKNDLNVGISQAVLSLRHFHTLKNTVGAQNQLSMICYISDAYMAPIVSEAWTLYCSDMSIDSQNTLITVLVSHLPKDALCEWGGIAYNEKYVVDEDTDFDGSFKSRTRDIESLVSQSVVGSNNYNSIFIENNELIRKFTTLFIDNDEDVVNIIKKLTNCQIALYYSPIRSVTLPMESHVEYVPVNGVYDESGDLKKYALSIKH
ncbi:diphthine--ammonia ligase Ecym_4223 [Eremothecium cymbalariae DBVPG|uniref:Diphthine--ammonia ligase n=1 Tax=Eremothecium cymbalariae (strain CBS 270.75 / DBVPG 7215 / KCTC 17166 / NRRL Y-17582) TaxID=931890 RepID=G8JTD7_ERECY|nr:hypothetical protein Ecym_4223 [Eremothecium cymbalariae DBVPG\